MKNNIFDKYLSYISILYLTIPYFLFFGGWFRIYYAIIFIAILSTAVFFTLKSLKNTFNTSINKEDLFSIKYSPLIISLVLIILWVILSGTGGIGFQNNDYFKHNAILSDLIKHDWPVKYGETNYFKNIYDSLLVYYIAYYLPAAFVGKCLGWKMANVAILCWTVIGITLAVYWCFSLLKRYSVLFTVLFIFFSGMDILGHIMTRLDFPHGFTHIEFWAKYWQYTSMTAALFYVPHQAVVCWLLTAMLLSLAIRYDYRKEVCFIYVLAIFWSPFVFAGLFVFILLILFLPQKYTNNYSHKLKELFNFTNLVAAPMVVILVMSYYFAGPDMNLPNGLLWNVMDLYKEWNRLLFFYIFEFALLLLFIGSVDRKLSVWFYCAVICLFLIPFYKFGEHNDFVMRVSLPSIMVLFLVIAKNILDKKLTTVSNKVLIILLVVGAITPLHEMAQCIKRFEEKQFISNILNLGAERFSRQYIGDSDEKPLSYILKGTHDIKDIIDYFKYVFSSGRGRCDLDRDGKSDLLGVNTIGQLYYTTNIKDWIYITDTIKHIACGDIDGNGKSDLVGIDIKGKLKYSYNLGKIWHDLDGELKKVIMADINGDGKDDIIGINKKSMLLYSTDLGKNWRLISGGFLSLRGGDINGDGKDELIGLSKDGEIFYTVDLLKWTKISGNLVEAGLGDLNGDGKSDIVGIDKNNGIFYTTDLGRNWQIIPGSLIHIVVVDLNGDGITDIAGIDKNHNIYYTIDLGSNWKSIDRTLLLIKWIFAF